MQKFVLAILFAFSFSSLASAACQRTEQMIWAGGQFPFTITSDYGPDVSVAQLSEIMQNGADVVKAAKAMEGKGAKGGESISFKGKTTCDGKEMVDPTVVIVGLAPNESAKIFDKALSNARAMVKKVAAKGAKK